MFKTNDYWEEEFVQYDDKILDSIYFDDCTFIKCDFSKAVFSSCKFRECIWKCSSRYCRWMVSDNPQFNRAKTATD